MISMPARALTVALLTGVLVACSAGSASGEPSGGPDPERWHPEVGASFHIQYTGELDLNQRVSVYNLDGESTSAEDVAVLRARGVDSICYINAGAYENWRTDKKKFPAAVIGQPLDGWPGEKWLDIRKIDALMPIMGARMDQCAEKGFVAVDPDNTDGWSQRTGFSITKADQIAYQKALAKEAHRRGLAIGLKNDIDQIDDMAEFVDFAVNEQCGQYRECDGYETFLASGKPVYNIEYGGSRSRVCSDRPEGMSTVIKDLSLSARTTAC